MITTTVMTAIAACALFGSAVGSFFEARLWAVVWSTPVVAALGGVLLVVAPEMEGATAAPEWLSAAVVELAQPALIIQGLIACATGALVASAAVRYVQGARQRPMWMPSMDDGPGSRVRPRRAAAPASPGERLSGRVKGLESSTIRARLEGGDFHAPAQPVFQVEPQVALAAERIGRPDARPTPASSQPSGPNHRAGARRRALLSGHLLMEGGQSVGCTIQNLSVGGAQVKLAYAVAAPRRLWLIDVSNGLAHQAEPAWRRGASMGLKFHASLDLKSPKGTQAEALRKQWLALAPR